MSTLYLAEKASQGRDIANAIGGAQARSGYIEVNGGLVTWCIGHMLEQAMPEAYNPDWGKNWTFDVLPMVPSEWKSIAVSSKASQLSLVRRLLAKANDVVIATDAGREGELIAREILEYARYRGPVRRLWTSSLVKSDIQAALRSLKPGSATEPLYEAALARSRADWLYGLNATRGVTLSTQRRALFPVGRVQTPTLGIVVRREWEIRNFKPADYFELEAKMSTAAGARFSLFHAPAEDARITDRSEAMRLCSQAEGAQGPLQVETKAGTEAPPLPHTTSTLQTEANKRLGLTAKDTLKMAQELYEAKAITYPRTDCPYLAESHKGEVQQTLDCLAQRYPDAVTTLRTAGVHTRDTTFNDAKLTDHHGIVPTADQGEVPEGARPLYALVVERYLQTLGPDCRFDRTTVRFDANGVPFKASGKAVTDPGFRKVTVGVRES